jgi:O-antigen biosynthesis protein
MEPLVSCILVTRDRPAFFRQAVKCFAGQRYRRRELIVVDDGESPVEKLCRSVPGAKYIRLGQRTPTGSKLNIGIEAATGRILQKLDDDDYYGPAFVSTASRHLRDARDPHTLVAWCCFVVLIAGDRQLYFSGHGWHSGGTLCFHRQLWERQPFRDTYASSDSWFIRDNQPAIKRVCAGDQYLVVRHGRNTWRRIKGADSVEGYFQRRPLARTVDTIVDARSVPFYRALMTRGASEPWTDRQ